LKKDKNRQYDAWSNTARDFKQQESKNNEKKLKEIIDSMINGSFDQASEQINAYPLYDFWSDYINHIENEFGLEDAYKILCKTIKVVFNHIESIKSK